MCALLFSTVLICVCRDGASGIFVFVVVFAILSCSHMCVVVYVCVSVCVEQGPVAAALPGLSPS